MCLLMGMGIHTWMSRLAHAPELPSVAEICSRTQEVFGKTPCLFQIELCLAQLQGHHVHQDIISIAPTGSGKTLCFLMPLLFNNDKIIIIVTALNLLGDQFCRQASEAGVNAVIVTSANNTRETFRVCDCQKLTNSQLMLSCRISGMESIGLSL